MGIPFAKAMEPIIIQNPGKRHYKIKPGESGINYNQFFSSKNFPAEIKGDFLGLVKEKGKIYPAYVLEISGKKLWLSGKIGYDKGPSIMDNICHELFAQNGILKSRSIKMTDLGAFHYEKEKLIYWLASRVEMSRGDYIHGEYCVDDGVIRVGRCFDNNYIYDGYYIRPVVILACTVTGTKGYNRSWVEL